VARYDRYSNQQIIYDYQELEGKSVMIGDQVFYVDKITATIDVDLEMTMEARPIETSKTTTLEIVMKAKGSPTRHAPRDRYTNVTPRPVPIEPKYEPPAWSLVEAEVLQLGEGKDG
jgi:hypothetical protein